MANRLTNKQIKTKTVTRWRCSECIDCVVFCNRASIIVLRSSATHKVIWHRLLRTSNLNLVYSSMLHSK